jgi:hypothetical protein
MLITPRSGAADFAQGTIAVDNMVNGVSLFQMNNGLIVNTFNIACRGDSPADVKFAAGGRLVITGSDHGFMYVFDAQRRVLVEQLLHTRRGYVQHIAVRCS